MPPYCFVCIDANLVSNMKMILMQVYRCWIIVIFKCTCLVTLTVACRTACHYKALGTEQSICSPTCNKVLSTYDVSRDTFKILFLCIIL